jgi:aspartate kinase
VQEKNMFESNKVLSINSHDLVLKLTGQFKDSAEFLNSLKQFCSAIEIPDPQLLHLEQEQNIFNLYITAPKENLQAIQNNIQKSNFTLGQKKYSSIAATCTGSATSEISRIIAEKLAENKIAQYKILMSPMSVVSLINQEQKETALKLLHEFIEP